MRPRTLAAAGLALALAAAAAGCGAHDDGAPAGGGDGAAETAATVCALLRRWNDDLGGIVDATAQAITDDDDPATANQVLLDGYDELLAAAEGHVAEVDELALPDTPDRDALVEDLRAGAQESVDVLEDERADAAELGPIGLEQQGGALGAALTGVERAVSVLEPPAADYGADLRAAFAEDEGCRHVVQPTGA